MGQGGLTLSHRKRTNQNIITMHSNIFEIQDTNFKPDSWAGWNTIADSDSRIDGVDYWDEQNEDERVEVINDFFLRYFPDNSFKVVKNEPGETAVVEFVGDIKSLYASWMEQIKNAANELNDEMTSTMLHNVRNALDEPFELSSKFYMENWCGCTAGVDDFLSWLRHLSRKNEGKPFRLYIGQVFDYHF